MKKSVLLLAILLLLSISLPLLEAQNTSNSTEDTSKKTTTSTAIATDDKDKIENGFECLENKADDCKGLSTQEAALTILASPDENFDECVDELISREKGDHFGSVRDTALAILALDHAGEDTEDYEEWLLDQEQNPSELVWYLQQDSNEKAECSFRYDGQSHTAFYGENKKISANAGSCLTRAQSNFWLQVNPDCYDEHFLVQCDREFITNFIYKNKNSETVYVLENTESAPAYDTVNMSLTSKCFGDSSTCDYEATAWATLALLETKHDVDPYIPYLIALSDTNKQYLPDAFIYLVTDYEDYANELLEAQKLGNYWQAEKSAYGRFYDSALALLALGRTSSSDKIKDGRSQLLFSQGSNGCWANSVRDTAIVLWALEGRAGRSSGGSGGSVTACGTAGFFCLAKSECPGTEVLNNYHCKGLSTVCCKTENLKTCSELGGKTCPSGESCLGNAKKSSDASACCLGTCGVANKKTECETQGGVCRAACSSKQEQTSYTCNQGSVCCKAKPEPESSGSWGLIITLVILIILVILAIIYRKKLGLWWFALRTKFKKDKGPAQKPNGPSPRRPPRPGTAPYRRMPPRRGPAPPRRPAAHRPHDKEFSDTFEKLRGFSK